MTINYLESKPDGITGYCNLLYGVGEIPTIGNAYFYKTLQIFIMYDLKGNYMGEQINELE